MADTPVERERMIRRLHAAAVANFPAGLSDQQLLILLDDLEGVGEAINCAVMGRLPVATGEDWMDELVAKAEQRLRPFFGKSFDMTPMVNALTRYGREKVERWQSLGLTVGYLPAISLDRKTKLRKWRTRPEAWFWQKLGESQLYRRNAKGRLACLTEVGLEGIVVLFDARQKPSYDNAKQMYANDGNFMGPIITRLRGEGKIQSHPDVPLGSRFYISSLEWDKHLRSAVAEFLGLETIQVRLETVLEGNLIPQLFNDTPRVKDGTTDTWEWREEFYGGGASCRLDGGFSGSGGLASVGYGGADFHWSSRAVRPVGVLDAWSV